MSITKKILELAGVDSPTEAPKAEDWSAAELDIGLALPKDFKELVSGLGSGSFGAGLYLKNPRASSVYVQLSREALVSNTKVVAEGARRSGLVLFPEPAGLITIAGIDRQDFLLRPKGSRCSDEVVWWDLDVESSKDLNMSISRLIHDLYFGKIEESWAEDLREYIWRGNTLPFFKQWHPR